MDPAKVRIFQLKAEVLKLANRIVSQDGTGNVEIYVLSRDELEGESVEGQIQMLEMQVACLNDILNTSVH